MTAPGITATGRLMSEHCEGVLRTLYALGSASLADALTAYRVRPMSAPAMRNVLDVLIERGWLARVKRPGSDWMVHYVVTEPALAHLYEAARLPMYPAALGAPGSAARRAASRGTPLPAVGKVAPPPYRVAPHELYVPPPAPPLRPGADDFRKYRSLGAFV